MRKLTLLVFIIIGVTILILPPMIDAELNQTDADRHGHVIGCHYFAKNKCVRKEICLQEGDTLQVVRGKHRVFEGDHLFIPPSKPDW